MVIEFQNEAINTWHNHTVNLYSVFLSYYPTVPEKILSIALLNKGYTGSTYTYYNPSNQTTNFDFINPLPLHLDLLHTLRVENVRYLYDNRYRFFLYLALENATSLNIYLAPCNP